MPRFAIQSVLALGVVIASAIFDFGSRAEAAFLKATPSAASMAASTTPDEAPNPFDPNELDKAPPPPLDLQEGGGMSSPSTGGNSGSASAPGLLARFDPPTDGLVVYFREPAASLRFSSFIDSILDPPRAA